MDEWKQNVKTKIVEEKVKLKAMNFKEKRDYIWEYYKLPIIATLVTCFFIGSIINNVFINPPKNTFVHFAFFGSYVSDASKEQFATLLTDELVTDKDKEMCYTTGFYLNAEDPQVNMAMMQKLMAMVAARDLDLMFVDAADFQDMCKEGFFMDLGQVLNTEDIAAYQDFLLEGYYEEEERNCLLGIKMDGNPLLSIFDTPMEGSILTVVASSDRLDNVRTVLRYMLAKGN